MGWFRTPKTTAPNYTGLQLQTSVSALPIPIVWGRTKVSANIIWYGNFQTHGGGGGKGGLFGGGNQAVSYSADVILAVCEGPIGGIGTIWKGQATYTLAGLGLSFFNGASPQTPWGYLAAAAPSQALAYQGTAYVCAAGYSLGSNAGITNHNFEVIGLLAGTGVNGIDADPAAVIGDFLTNPQYGAGFSAANVNAATLFGTSGDSSLQSYCRAQGIAFSPALINQEPASGVLTRWLALLNCAAVWSSGQLKFIPYGDAPILAGATSARQYQASVPQPVQPATGPTPGPSLIVCPAAQWIADGGVKYAISGAALSYAGAFAPASAGAYGISPPGAYLFAPGDQGKVVNIGFTSATAGGFTPNVTPVYSLTDLDFVDQKGNKDPVQATRADPFSLPTVQRLECLSRSNQYVLVPVEARDQSQIEALGLRVGSTIQAREICDEISVAPTVAQAAMQRALYVRCRFTFKLSWEHCLLEPMDVVALTDANLGLNAYAVRILSIEEDEQGLLSVTAEELVAGVSTPALYPNASAYGFQPNQAAAAATVNPPLVYEPPASLTGGAAQLWLGASGAGGDPNWGGAYVWLSLDGTAYSQIATINAPARQGYLSGALPAAAGWDAANALGVSLAESGGALGGTTQASAQQGATLSLVDGELIAYQNAALQAPSAYALSGLQRGMYGTAAAAHAAGAPFCRLDSAIVKYALPANAIGQALTLKFQSFNVFGSGVQPLSSCQNYAYAPAGAGSASPIAAQMAGSPNNALDLGLVSVVASVRDDFGPLTVAPSGAIDLGSLSA